MFKAGFYETEVTPPLGTFMPGSSKYRYAENVKDKVYAKAVVIDNGAETVAAVVLDSVSLSPNAHDIVVKSWRNTVSGFQYIRSQKRSSLEMQKLSYWYEA